MQMPDNEESGVDTILMSKGLTEGDDPLSQEIAALAKTFMDHDINSLENDDDWKNFKVALWDSLTSGPDDESHSHHDATFATSHESSSSQASLPTNTMRSQVNEALEHANSSPQHTSLFSDSDTATDSVDLSSNQSYLPDLLKLLNENDIELRDDEESRTTRIQFRGREYILSNDPQENVDNVLIDGFDYFEPEKRGHNEDVRPAMSEKIESHEDIFKVWDLGIQDEEDEITKQLKALAMSGADLSIKNSTADSVEEKLYGSMVNADGDGYVGTWTSSEDLSSNVNETNLDELIQGITEMSLNQS